MTALLFVGLFLFRVELELVQIIVTGFMFAMPMPQSLRFAFRCHMFFTMIIAAMPRLVLSMRETIVRKIRARRTGNLKDR